MMEVAEPGGLPMLAERMQVVIADARPVLEEDSELEGGGRRAHELLLVDAQEAVECADGRNGRLSDTDGADLLGLHQRDVQQIPELLRESGRRNPPGSAPARDDN